MKNLNIDKVQVAQRFAKAGQSYAEQAIVQKKICQHLIALMQNYLEQTDFEQADLEQTTFERGFEIGCGSGNLTQLLLQNFKIKNLILNDLYPEVQQHFLDQKIYLDQKKLEWLIGDIEQLNFPQNLDVIASSSALQWMVDLDAILKKSSDALNSNGWLCFSTFGQQNFKEVKALTGQGLDYLDLESIREKLEAQGFDVLHLSESIETLSFDHPKQVLQHLKATGVTATATQHRWTKQSLQQFYSDYQQFSNRDERGQITYSLTYHPIYCIARRKP
ncbi:malonyl-ACP O-methyltransferase BioC [Acinetobacter sp. ANC 3832]|uniref:malonyl-ACP O-methyltransferase BioC n=1 Tax=Acinetobacter sp. ANC 3832 TaxID=1977874 RepID=UPI000A33D601|nr:malonyl-ACP O-methyltransferase BioC [Acinetobacter sp. ANC 3832]OTG94106.1 malonyl-[acyl-carrier protein] O-methyltransferase BioC [Acinetobacter sp. ANC 3832]